MTSASSSSNTVQLRIKVIDYEKGREWIPDGRLDGTLCFNPPLLLAGCGLDPQGTDGVVTGLDTLKTIQIFDGFEFALMITENSSRLLLSASSFHQDRILPLRSLRA